MLIHFSHLELCHTFCLLATYFNLEAPYLKDFRNLHFLQILLPIVKVKFYQSWLELETVISQKSELQIKNLYDIY